MRLHFLEACTDEANNWLCNEMARLSGYARRKPSSKGGTRGWRSAGQALRPPRWIAIPGYLRVFVFALFFFFGGITSLNDVIIPRLKELFTLSYAEVMTRAVSVLRGLFYHLAACRGGRETDRPHAKRGPFGCC